MSSVLCKWRFWWFCLGSGGTVFEVARRAEIESAMKADGVIEGFDIVEDGQLGGPAGSEALARRALGFEGAPEALDKGVVVAVAFAAHAAGQGGCGEGLAVLQGGVLDAAIGMMDELGLGAPLAQG